MASPSAVDLVKAAELRLLDPALRSRPDLLVALVHADFVEFGASGRIWTRADLAQVSDWPVVGTPTDLHADQLAEDVILLTFRMSGPTPSLRSSVWVREPDGSWVLRFHQGTAEFLR